MLLSRVNLQYVHATNEIHQETTQSTGEHRKRPPFTLMFIFIRKLSKRGLIFTVLFNFNLI